MPDNQKLPPLSEEAFDGDNYKTELRFNKCSHKDVQIVGNELRCKCGAGYMGSNIAVLYKLLKEQS